MNRYFIRKVITAICFVLTITSGLIANLIYNKDSLRASFREHTELDQTVMKVDRIVNDNMYGRYVLIDTFGYLQHLMGKKEENNFEIIKDHDGLFHYTFFGTKPKDTTELIDRLADFRERIENDQTKFFYAMTPDKMIEGYTTFDNGMPYNYANETADLFLADLTDKGITYIDFRENLMLSGIDPSEFFYKTNHHWKVETAFWAFGELLDQLQQKFGESFENKEFYTDIANYNTITYENSYLGSMARNSGMIYSGVDDFTLIYPKFPTNYVYRASIYDYDVNTQGRFEQALINRDTLCYQGNKYDVEGDKYASYLYGNKGVAHIKNELNPDGPKVLIVKDSFMIPVASFLSTVCSDVYLVDPRYYEDSIIDYTNSIDQLDYVMVSFTPQDLTDEFFDFDR